MPVSPPNVNKQIKAKVKIMAGVKEKQPPEIVANQLHIFTPVGIAITIVAAVK